MYGWSENRDNGEWKKEMGVEIEIMENKRRKR